MPPQLPLHHGYLLGHEAAGTVVRLGAGAEVDSLGGSLAFGDRVVWTGASCGHCPACTVWNEPGLCPSRKGPLSIPSDTFPHLTGTFAEYAYVLPRSERVRVPDEVRSEWASAASCALRTVMHTMERVGPISPSDVVVVQGTGPIGLFALAVAKHAGARTVIVVGGPANRLDVAGKWGADHLVPVAGTDPDGRCAAVAELTGGRGADIVIEASGAPSSFAEGLAMVRPGGRYAIAGAVTAEPTPVAVGLIASKQVTVLGVWSARIGHYWQALEFLTSARASFDFDLVLTTEFGLADVADALAGMATGQEIKPVIRTGAGRR
jgi:threonine dehydrogenase-like Zn-dependent dehydrogenase